MTGTAEALAVPAPPFSGVHAALSGLGADDHLQYALLAGRAGGQALIGGLAAGELLTLQGSAAANRGRVLANGGITIDWDWSSDAVAAGGINSAKTVPSSGGYIGAFITLANQITVDNGLFILSALDDLSTLTWTVAPGFAVETLFFARPTYQSVTPGIPPAQAFTLASQTQYRLTGAGNVGNAGYRCISFAPIIRVDNAGDQMHFGATSGVTVFPLFNTRNATAVADFGIIRGVWMGNAAAVAFGGQGLGSEIATEWIGLDVEQMTGLVVSGRKAVVRGRLAAGANNRFLENIGGALSDFLNGDAHFNDAGSVIFGTGNDVAIEWDGTAGAWNWNPAVGEDLGVAFGISSGKPTYLFEAETFGQSEVNYTQIRFGFDRFAFGQTGTIGNQVGVFVAGNRTVEVPGGWADFLLTQGGGLNIGVFAMSDVSAWIINQISLDNTAGSIASLDTFVVGGMTTSNPGITVTERSAMRITGRTKLRGSVQYPPITPAALSAGDNDDWAGLLTGSPNNNGRYWARVTGNATPSVITGIDATAVQDGDTFELTNVGGENILLSHQDAGSAAANRIIEQDGNQFVLHADGSVKLRYDRTAVRWRIITPPGAVAPLTGFWRYDSNTTMADPGAGAFRTNNAAPASVTSLALSDISYRGGDLSNILGQLASGDRIYMQSTNDGSEYLVLNISGVTDNGTWFQIDGTVNSSGNTFTNNKEFAITSIFT